MFMRFWRRSNAMVDYLQVLVAFGTLGSNAGRKRGHRQPESDFRRS
jgi:hypothetical protein